MAYGRVPTGHMQLPVLHDNLPHHIYQSILGSGSEAELDYWDGGLRRPGKMQKTVQAVTLDTLDG